MCYSLKLLPSLTYNLIYVLFYVLTKENCHEKEKGGMIQNFKRTLSRKEKKTEKNKTKAAEKISADENG